MKSYASFSSFQNHFQIVETNFAHKLTKSRDLPAEISKEEAVQATASVISEFIEVHQTNDGSNDLQKKSLLQKIKTTEHYLQPLLDAMKLEGNHHLAKPCNLIEDEECDITQIEQGQACSCNAGSPWVEKIQNYLTPEGVKIGDISDEFHRSWAINPFADPPFYHPKARSKDSGDEAMVDMETVSEAVYEKPDFFFDGGLFSNTAVELRSKFNSPQAILKAAGVSVPFEPRMNTCSKMNELAIQYALDHAPARVRERYIERGIKLRAGKDIEHTNGPSWIWSHLDFSKEGDCDDEDEPCRIIDSHRMTTEVDHPVPFVGGKLYCKLLSPARVLDWMYTDSLRIR